MHTDPSTYPRRVLVAVTGLAPQVVTETVYALARQRSPAFIPTEIHIATSERGAELAAASLLDTGEDQLGRLCRDYALGPIWFDADSIHILKDREGRPVGDLQTPESQAHAADAITNLIQELTRDDSAALHVSLAGGRKTMSYYIGYAISMFGRPQDQLSHILVSEPFEEVKDFYYPPPQPRQYTTRSGQEVNSEQAQVLLAEIPFLRLRRYLPSNLLKSGVRFSDAVEAVAATVGPPRLVYDETTHELWCGGVLVNLTPMLLAFYLWFARRAARGEGPVSARDFDLAGPLAEYKSLVKSQRLLMGTEKNFTKEDLLSQFSKIKNALIKALGQFGAEPYLIQRQGQRSRAQYLLPLPPANIQFKTNWSARHP